MHKQLKVDANQEGDFWCTYQMSMCMHFYVTTEFLSLHALYSIIIEYVRVFKSLLLTEINALYTYDTHQLEALQICRQMLLS